MTQRFVRRSTTFVRFYVSQHQHHLETLQIRSLYKPPKQNAATQDSLLLPTELVEHGKYNWNQSTKLTCIRIQSVSEFPTNPLSSVCKGTAQFSNTIANTPTSATDLLLLSGLRSDKAMAVRRSQFTVQSYEIHNLETFFRIESTMYVFFFYQYNLYVYLSFLFSFMSRYIRKPNVFIFKSFYLYIIFRVFLLRSSMWI